MTPQLMEALASPVYCISTNGARFKHPDRETLDIVTAHHAGPARPIVDFNYRSPFTKHWAKSKDVDARFEADAVVTLDSTGE